MKKTINIKKATEALDNIIRQIEALRIEFGLTPKAKTKPTFSVDQFYADALAIANESIEGGISYPNYLLAVEAETTNQRVGYKLGIQYSIALYLQEGDLRQIARVETTAPEQTLAAFRKSLQSPEPQP